MKKIFLYLYPIKEFSEPFLLSNEHYQSKGQEHPFTVLNECLNKRYRQNGYEVVFAIYPDKDIFGIEPDEKDIIIPTDVTFWEAIRYNEDGSNKSMDEIKYPSEEFIFDQLINTDEIVIGGYHFNDCVKRVAECFLTHSVPTLVDLELTDLFFNLYKQKYFNRDCYNSANFKEYMIGNFSANGYGTNSMVEKQFDFIYSSPAYQFEKSLPTIHRKDIVGSKYQKRK